jgi:DNA-binding response OmpR family regulator
LGAADYLTKPLSAATLGDAVARAQIRQTHAPAETQHRPAEPFHSGPVVLHPERFSIEVDGKPVAATPSEYEILLYLFRHAGRVVTAHEMVQSIRGYRVEPHEAPELIRPHISNLRRKLIAVQPAADVVQTVRGVGYILRRGD